jgi:hypothetical protein
VSRASRARRIAARRPSVGWYRGARRRRLRSAADRGPNRPAADRSAVRQRRSGRRGNLRGSGSGTTRSQRRVHRLTSHRRSGLRGWSNPGRLHPGAVLALGPGPRSPAARCSLRVDCQGGGQVRAAGRPGRPGLLESSPIPGRGGGDGAAQRLTHRNPTAVEPSGGWTRRPPAREAGVEVIVGTCPDLGTPSEQIPHPAALSCPPVQAGSWPAAQDHTPWSRRAARTVSLGDLLGPEFAARPLEMFSVDTVPSLGHRLRPGRRPPCCPAWHRPRLLAGRARPASRRSVAVRASTTSRMPRCGRPTPPVPRVGGIEVSGSERGPRGRWVAFFRAAPRPRSPNSGQPRQVPSLWPPPPRTEGTNPGSAG